MADKSWKSFERRIAKLTGGRRIPNTEERNGADVISDAFVYQCKLRRGQPSYLKKWLNGIVSAGKRVNAIGCVVWKAPHKPDDEAVVILRLKDWQELHGPEKTKRPTIKPSVSRSTGDKHD